MATVTRFDEIAKRYDKQIPKHIREHLCVKKVDFMLKKLKRYKDYVKFKGLDCGCGTGWHVKRFWENELAVDGIDISEEMIEEAKKNNKNNAAQFVVSSIDGAPFKNETYDFVYFINILHHLKTLEAQKKALEEAYRLLKTGGVLFIQEVNEDFFLFRIYMKYIFPLTNKIHGGKRTEKYLDIKHILDIAKETWLLRDVEYFTFLPNVTPAFAFPILKKFEALLEKSTENRFGAHWIMTLEKAK